MRDPRRTPVPGDVIDSGKTIRRVLSSGIQPLSKEWRVAVIRVVKRRKLVLVMDDIEETGEEFDVSIRSWRRWAADGEVVVRGEP
jgi:hypoxanthine phosphoribosyltransferase